MAKRGNPYHVKKGSPEGGQFTSGGGGSKDRAAELNDRARKNLPDFKKRMDAINAAARKAAGLEPELPSGQGSAADARMKARAAIKKDAKLERAVKNRNKRSGRK